MDDIPQDQPEVVNPSLPEVQIIQPQETPIKSFDNIIERNKSIINQYTSGTLIKNIAFNHGISEPQVYNVVRKHPGIILTNREAEKNRRLRRLKLMESKTPKNMSAKNATELVNILKAQKDELEPESNTINIDARSVNVMTNDPELIESIKNISAMFAKLLVEPKSQTIDVGK